MERIFHVEKKTQADAFFKKMNFKKKEKFAYELEDGNKIVWFPIFYLLGVLIELDALKKGNTEGWQRMVDIYRITPLPKMLAEEKEITIKDMEENFGSYLGINDELKNEFKKIVEEFKSADEIVFFGDGLATRLNFKLLYLLSNSKAKCFMFIQEKQVEEMDFQEICDVEEEISEQDYDKELFKNTLKFLKNKYEE